MKERRGVNGNMQRIALVVLFLIATCAVGVRPARAAGPTLVVTSTNDAGPGSLRQAILAANARPGPDVITFAIAGGPGAGGWHSIVVESLLPPITDPVTL